MVAKWLGFKEPAYTGRSSIRGFADSKASRGFGSKFLQFFGNGVRSGFIPCDDGTVYWFFTWSPSDKGNESYDFVRIAQLLASVVFS